MTRWIFIMIVGALCAGCGGTAAKAPKASKPPGPAVEEEALSPITNSDACATRMHDLCGSLLLYYATRHALPEHVEELREVPGFPGELACPVSQQPYVYDRGGMPVGNRGARVVLWDASAVHDGMRWGIAIGEGAGNQPVEARVIALPESMFENKPEPAAP
jgi:hypothetical protein